MKTQCLILLVVLLASCQSNLLESGQNSAAKPKEKRSLYLIRHAKSSHKDDSLADFDRPLNDRGKGDAKLMGEMLFERGIVLDKMLISPSKRTKSTAKRLAKELHFEKDSIVLDTNLYRCKTQALLAAIRNLDVQYKQVAIVGHNPSIIQIANHFQKDTIFTDVPTCGIIAIDFESTGWKYLGNKEGKYAFFDCPKRHKTKEHKE